MLNLNSLLVFSQNPKQLVEFYKKVFNMEVGWTGGDFSGFKVGNGIIAFGPHDKVHGKNSNPERIIINYESDDFAKEFERVKSTGAKVIQEPYHPGEDLEMSLATFEDPDGNYFQLTTPMKM